MLGLKEWYQRFNIDWRGKWFKVENNNMLLAMMDIGLKQGIMKDLQKLKRIQGVTLQMHVKKLS